MCVTLVNNGGWGNKVSGSGICACFSLRAEGGRYLKSEYLQACVMKWVWSQSACDWLVRSQLCLFVRWWKLCGILDAIQKAMTLFPWKLHRWKKGSSFFFLEAPLSFIASLGLRHFHYFQDRLKERDLLVPPCHSIFRWWIKCAETLLPFPWWSASVSLPWK